MRTVILTSILFCFGLGVNAQTKNEKLLKMATNEYKNLRYAYAIPLFKASLKEDPKNTFALSSLANSYKVNNQYDSAIKYFEMAKSAGSSIGYNLTELYANKGAYVNALKALNLDIVYLEGENKSSYQPTLQKLENIKENGLPPGNDVG